MANDLVVPHISSHAVGPLGACHLPRMWLKIFLHATGRLPPGYRHGTGGADETTAKNLGFDRDAFIEFVETRLPTYLEAEAWVRQHAKNIDPDSIRKHNEIVHRDKPEWMAKAQRLYVGLDDPSARNSTLLNDLDDWHTLHAHVTTGKIPPLALSSLNAAMTEVLKSLLDATKSSRATIRIDMPSIAMTPSTPAAEAKRSNVDTLMGQDVPNISSAAPVEFLRRERRPCVQDDAHDVPAGERTPAELLAQYGMRAQMLGPIFRDGNLIAWISVHDCTGPRKWSAGDIQALEVALEDSAQVLDEICHPELVEG
ncbi:MAG: GAF domain-containing protein [Candidatus Eremiobacteraeota bacterium]|nr:GAF domain-containing protein [Candidatus Eremiobacteraeota bacterium]